MTEKTDQIRNMVDFLQGFMKENGLKGMKRVDSKGRVRTIIKVVEDKNESDPETS